MISRIERDLKTGLFLLQGKNFSRLKEGKTLSQQCRNWTGVSSFILFVKYGLFFNDFCLTAALLRCFGGTAAANHGFG